MIGRSGPEHHNLYSPRQTGKATAEVNVSVNDIDGHYARATAAGAVIGTPLEDAPWGYRHYEAVDPEGHGWHFLEAAERPPRRNSHAGRSRASSGLRRRTSGSARS